MSEEKKPNAAQPDADKSTVNVSARGVESRYRAGMRFDKDPQPVSVDAKTLAVLKADPYLQIEAVA